jgi:hypothetical protein
MIPPDEEFIKKVLDSTTFQKTIVTSLAVAIYKEKVGQKIVVDKKEFKNGFYLLKTRKVQFGEIRENIINQGYLLCTKNELITFVKENPDEPRINRIVSLAEQEATRLGHLVYPTIVHSRRPSGNQLSSVHVLSNNSGYRVLVKKK